MKKFIHLAILFLILSLVFPAGVFAANRVAQLPLESGLVDPYGELTSGSADRVSDVYVVNSDNVMVLYSGNDAAVTAAEILTDGDFTGDGSAWTFQTDGGGGWSFDGPNDEADCDGNQVGEVVLSQNEAAIAEHGYLLTITTSGRTAGTLTPEFGSIEGDPITVDVTGAQIIIFASDTDFLKLKADADWDGSVESVSLKDVTLSDGSGTAEAPFDSKGIVNIGPVTNWLLQSRDWTQAIWTKNNITPAYTSVGVDGVANKATRLTATAANGTAVQVLTVDGTTNSWFFWARRITGTGDVQLTDDNFTSNTVLSLTSSWKKFEVNDAGSAPTVGIKIVTNTDAIDVDFGMLIDRPYSVPWAIPTLSVPVTTTAQTIPWTMSTVFKGILSDAVNGSESEGTLIASWTPYFNHSDQSDSAGIIAITPSGTSVLYASTFGRLASYDSSNVTIITSNWVKNTTYTLIVRWSKRQDSLQISVIDAGVLTNGSAESYDGAFTLGTFIIGYANNYPFSIKDIHVYGEWIVDNRLGRYPAFIDGIAAW